jgi:methylamine dehydrogenase heavy chain
MTPANATSSCPLPTRRWSAPALRLTLSAALVATSLLGASAHAAAPAKPAAAQPPELPAETLTTTDLKSAGKDRIYVADVAIAHIVDGRLRVFSAKDGKVLGMINTGFAGNFALSAQADEIYIATTYLSRGGRGDRTDILEVWDADTLGFKYEVTLPPKRAQTLNYRGMVRPSGNGKFVMVQNATPATSVTVVDLANKKVATEVATPGCWGIWPAASGARFSMLCGDGKVATITLDDAGQVAERQVSDKLFDADQDAWYHTAEQQGDRAWFLSFKGTLTELDLGGAVAKQKSAVSIVSAAAAKAGWRPGGYQAFAVDPAAKVAVVAMHDKGGEGTHKRPARQLWIVDLATGRQLATAPGKGSASLTFARASKRLQALDGETGAMNVWTLNDAGKAPALKLVTTVKRAGEAALHIESGD